MFVTSKSKDAVRDDEFDDQLDDEIESDDDETIAKNSDNIGDASVEINVDELIAEMEAEGLPTDHLKGSNARHRLEELMEQKRLAREFSDFDFEID